MGHLKDVGLTYWEHLRLAAENTVKLASASAALAVHSVAPSCFEHTTSDILKNVMRSMPKTGSRILVRFNTKWEQDPDRRQWRVLVDGVESLAHRVRMKTECETIEEPVDGVPKFHFLCKGKVVWHGTFAEIV